NDARAKGDLYQGSVTNPDSPGSKPKQANAALSSIATEAIHTQETNPFERQFNPEQKSHQQNNSFSQASNEESLGPESEASFQEKEQSASTLIGSSF
ncbi:MAG: hypothetical protein KC506_01450, partial [Nanoarchaeota archaeon]|nr:hypothetical protein [Nanoarchaeota archaeon]